MYEEQRENKRKRKESGKDGVKNFCFSYFVGSQCFQFRCQTPGCGSKCDERSVKECLPCSVCSGGICSNSGCGQVCFRNEDCRNNIANGSHFFLLFSSFCSFFFIFFSLFLF